MSQSLSTTLIARQNISVADDNLERGTVYVFTTGSMLSPLCFCWNAPGTGTAVIEIWGAGGSGSRMCCCGFGMPGNTGAYARRQISVTSACFVCGTVGLSCGNSSTLCNRGQSDPTQICWTGGGTAGCMCAQGGTAGYSYCSTSTAFWCCFLSGGWAGTCCGPGCGIICNTAAGIPSAFGGTVNCVGCFSCMVILRCDGGAIWHCGCFPSLPTPPGMSAVCGQTIQYGVDIGSAVSNASGAHIPPAISAIAASNRYGANFMPSLFACWTQQLSCGCYEMNGCISYVPPAFPGLPASPCGDVRDGGGRGGNGLVKITFF